VAPDVSINKAEIILNALKATFVAPRPPVLQHSDSPTLRFAALLSARNLYKPANMRAPALWSFLLTPTALASLGALVWRVHGTTAADTR